MQLHDNFKYALPHESSESQNKSIFEFWEFKEHLYPALYEVACSINAIPPLRGTVERSFSTLSYIVCFRTSEVSSTKRRWTTV